jgi:hypothetical protein
MNIASCPLVQGSEMIKRVFRMVSPEKTFGKVSPEEGAEVEESY